MTALVASLAAVPFAAAASGPTVQKVTTKNFVTSGTPTTSQWDTSQSVGNNTTAIGSLTDPTYVDGSLELALGGATADHAYAETAPTVADLTALTTMRYETYRADSNPPDPTVADILPSFEIPATCKYTSFTTLVFEPVYNPTQQAIKGNTWQSWDAYNGGNGIWWSTHDIKDSSGNILVHAHTDYVTWANMIKACGGGSTPGGTAFGYALSVGSGLTTPITTYTDDLQVNNTVYDFAATAPTVTNTLPKSISTDGNYVDFAGTLSNPQDGANYQNVRFDFTLSGISGLKASDLHLQYQDTNNKNAWTDLALTDQKDGSITGSFGPSGGFQLPPGTTNTSQFRVSVASGAPTGQLSVVTALNAVDPSTGAVVARQASDSSAVTLAPIPVPTVTAVRGTDGALWVRGSTDRGFHSLAGRIVGAPATVLAGGTDFFIARGTDNNLWVRSANTAWSPLGPRNTRCGQPGATADSTTTPATLVVACAGGDHALWYATTTFPSSGNPRVASWHSLGGVLRSGPAVWIASDGAHFGVVGGHGTGLWTRSINTGWVRSALDCDAQPAVRVSAGVTFTACRDSATGALAYQAGSFNGRTGRMIGRAGLAISASDGSRVSVYVEGTDGEVWTNTLTTKGAGGWQLIGGHAVNGASAAQSG